MNYSPVKKVALSKYPSLEDIRLSFKTASFRGTIQCTPLPFSSYLYTVTYLFIVLYHNSFMPSLNVLTIITVNHRSILSNFKSALSSTFIPVTLHLGVNRSFSILHSSFIIIPLVVHPW